MERKLLSLPSFFVLLLIAGIAFLAAPVADVQAQTAPTVTNAGLSGAITPATVGTDGATTPGTITVTIPFSAAVKLSAGALTSGSVAGAIAVGNGFGVEDLTVQTFPADTSDDDIEAGTGGTALSPALTNANLRGNGTATTSDTFTLTFPVPTDLEGKIKIAISASAGFQEQANTGAYVPDTDDNVVLDFDGVPPTVVIERSGLNTDSTVTGRFEVTFTLAEDVVTSGAGAFTADDITFSAIPTPAGQQAPTTPVPSAMVAPDNFGTRTADHKVRVLIDPVDGVESVAISVKAGVVRDAGGNGNAATAAGAVITVPVDNTKPTVTIEVGTGVTTTPGTPPTYSAGTNNFTVFFILSESPSADTGAPAFLKEDITITGGEIASLEQIEALDVRFEAMVEQDDIKTATPNVVIGVSADAFMDVAGNGNKALDTNDAVNDIQPLTIAVSGGSDPVDTGDGDDEETGTTGTLTGGKTLKFRLDVTNIPAVATSRFVVIARDAPNSTTNGISGAGSVVNINDNAWKDLQDFLAYDGGTIDLIGPPGTLKHDLVISEVMWGNDAGLNNPNNSQWIELYNTRSTKTGETRPSAILAGEWTLEFRAGGNPPSETSIPNFSDRFSNRTLGGGHWDFPNVAGGKYGQSGRTVLTPGQPGTLRDLVSMRRKLDYTKVEKNNHKEATGENRTEQLKGVPDGALAGSWEASTSRVNMSGTRKGTPGAQHVTVVGTTSISKSVVFNEIANRSEKKFDWIELYNPGSSDVKINNWVLSKVTGVDKDDELVKFESDENIVVPAKGFLLVVNEDPSETALASGKNVDNPNSNANGYPTEIYIDSGLDIPKDKFLLILRTESKLKSHEKIVDIGGHLAGLSLAHDDSATELWPLKAWKKIKEDDLLENNDKTWVRDKGKDLYHGDAWKSDGGFTGLGIDRNPDSDEGPTSGTPGFDNGAVKDKVKDLTASDPVVISEIMFGTGGTGNRRNPQWIELFNPSKTQAVKLHNWRLEVQNTTIDPSENLNVEDNYTLILPDKRIQPNQTLLIVSASAREATRDRFPSDRIINVWSTRTLRETVEMTSARDAILSSVAFYIKLSDPDKTVVDQVGNIERARDARDWDLPGGNLDDGGRASMMRRKGTFGNGTEADAWISAAVVDPGQKVGINELYYGDEGDLGTPGYRAGGPLPVQLSSFYSKRNAAGAVVITWSTESELDNAGFNILRSQSRTGEFVRINAQLIPGAGTTGEKTAYTWTDTSAKPNVLYFYQIEDVSLAGDHRTLRTTRLRGYIGAAGKATTTWGDLKSRE